MLRLDDPDADDLPPLPQRSVWGVAIPNAVGRTELPDDFQPDAFTGRQLCVGGLVRVPHRVASRLWHVDMPAARGAWVADWHLEVVVDVHGGDAAVESLTPVGQLIFEQAHGLDPFVVAAARVLKPLIAELRAAVGTTAIEGAAEIDGLRTEVERLADVVRATHRHPGRKQVLVAASLAAIGTILLSIMSNRLDGLLDQVAWPDLWDSVRRAARALGP